jgi:hypothetical protein
MLSAHEACQRNGQWRETGMSNCALVKIGTGCSKERRARDLVQTKAVGHHADRLEMGGRVDPAF